MKVLLSIPHDPGSLKVLFDAEVKNTLLSYERIMDAKEFLKRLQREGFGEGGATRRRSDHMRARHKEIMRRAALKGEADDPAPYD